MPIHSSVLGELKSRYGLLNYFETGLSKGRGVDSALLAGFDRIYSIDVCRRWIDEGREKYDGSIVTLIHDDSQNIFEHIKDIDERILFFLDAHNDHSNLDGENSSVNCPITQELEAISKHHIKNHIIVVDDVNIINSEQDSITAKGGEFKGRKCVNWGKDMQLNLIKKQILEINDYEFSIIDNQLFSVTS